MRKIENAEALLRKLGFIQFRVRYHNELERLEFIPDEVSLLNNTELRSSIDAALKNIGFSYVTIDLLGYRSGSRNGVIKSC